MTLEKTRYYCSGCRTVVGTPFEKRGEFYICPECSWKMTLLLVSKEIPLSEKEKDFSNSPREMTVLDLYQGNRGGKTNTITLSSIPQILFCEKCALSVVSPSYTPKNHSLYCQCESLN